MAILGNLAWEIFRAADTAIVKTGVRKSRLGKKSLASLNQLGTNVLRVMLSARSKPFLIHGHRMWLANSGSPSIAFTLSVILDRYESGTTRVLERLLKRGMTVLDVGAHVGYFVLLAARLVGPEGRVIAFEPDPSNIELLEKNIALNSYGNVTTFRKAVAECSERMTLVLDAKGSDRHALFLDCRRFSGKQDTVEVETVSLDDFIQEKNLRTIDLLKIDAEGAECAILRGLPQSLGSGKVRRMIFEFTPIWCEAAGVTPNEFLGQITNSGFDLFQIDAAGDLVPIPASSFAFVVEQARARGGCNLLAQLSRTN